MDDLPTELHRLGRAPDPLAYPPYEFCGHGRFDDSLLAMGHPAPWYRMLYLGETRIVCFLEVLQGFRPDLAYFARIAVLPDGDDDPDIATDAMVFADATTVSARWLSGKAMQSVSVDLRDGCSDLSSLRVRESLRSELAGDLLDLGIEDSISAPSRARIAR